jgi:EAL domain-containing protein (putative c-di-GMP-specific phosphodiesterase class I)
VLSPAEFIPLCERSNLLRPVTLYLIDSALRQCKEWREAGHDISVAVNLSMQNLLDLRLPTDIGELLKSWDLPEGSLELEVTESTIMADRRRAQTILGRLAKMGVRLSIDDFGTGYSSLHYLTRLPVDVLKIDRAFVAELNGSPEGSAITEAVIRLSQVLHLVTVAEGIETGDQAEELLTLGCTRGQGYLYAKPLPADRISPLILGSPQWSPDVTRPGVSPAPNG